MIGFGGQLLQLLTIDPLAFLIAALLTAFAMSAKNAIQALLASRLGDSTARLRGFTALNPTIHIDPISAVFVLLLDFGWTRPIPLGRLRSRSAEAWVWFSGPLTYFALAFTLLLAASLLAASGLLPNVPGGGLAALFATNDPLLRGLTVAALVLVRIGVVNLFPIPPLDGARALYAIGSHEVVKVLRQIESWGPIGFIAIFLVLSLTGIIGLVGGVVFNAILQLLNSILFFL